MVSLEDELGPEEEDLVKPYEKDVHNVVVRLVFLHHRLSLVSISAQKPPLLYSQPGDGRFSGIEIKLDKVLHTEEIEGEHVHPCKLKPLDKLLELWVSVREGLEPRECCDEQELDENLTLSF